MAVRIGADVQSDVTGRGKSSWRQRCASYIADLQSQVDRLRPLVAHENISIVNMADKHLEAARQAVTTPVGLRAIWSGSAVDRAWPNLHKTEEAILRISPRADLRWCGATVLAKAEQHLGAQDPRRRLLEGHLNDNSHELDEHFRDLAVRTLQAANDAADSERAQVRTFRNFLLCSVFALTILVVLSLAWGFLYPEALPEKTCFYPNGQRQCPVGAGAPSGADLMLVEFIGMCAAAVAGAISLRHIQGTATPYMVPMVLMLLRLPIGALSALLGIILVRGQFVPGLTYLDTSGQIAAWAIFFGVAQESITRMIDQQGNRVLDNARGSMKEFATVPTRE
ncbi:hypothetical protein [Kitasatospora terrestris]|uniref:Uncharacterized protein n=1 Tax=Kitasatospora terrestris TaxID=258051 RepID=A0ABP9EGE5_9ACTN